MEQKETTGEIRRSDFPETFVSLGHKDPRNVDTLVYREIAKRIPLQFTSKSASGSDYKDEELIGVWAENHDDVEKAHEMSQRVLDSLDFLILANASYGHHEVFEGLISGKGKDVYVLNSVAKDHVSGCGFYKCPCPIKEGYESAMTVDQLKRALAFAHETHIRIADEMIKEYGFKKRFWKKANDWQRAQKESSKALKTLKSEGYEPMSGEEMQQIIENAANRVLGTT